MSLWQKHRKSSCFLLWLTHRTTCTTSNKQKIRDQLVKKLQYLTAKLLKRSGTMSHAPMTDYDIIAAEHCGSSCTEGIRTSCGLRRAYCWSDSNWSFVVCTCVAVRPCWSEYTVIFSCFEGFFGCVLLKDINVQCMQLSSPAVWEDISMLGEN